VAPPRSGIAPVVAVVIVKPGRLYRKNFEGEEEEEEEEI
jgi:hypothetical protein